MRSIERSGTLALRAAAGLAGFLLCASASAQGAPTTPAGSATAPAPTAAHPPGYPPPPGYYPPPPGYYPPPPGYYPPPQQGHYPQQPGYYPPPGQPAPNYAPPAYYTPQQAQSDPQPKVETRSGSSDKKLLISGVVTFSVFYGLSAVVGAVAVAVNGGDGKGAEMLFIPVAGPFIAMGTLERRPGDAETLAYLFLDGLFQTAGAVCIVVGLIDGGSSGAARSPWIPKAQAGLGGGRLTWQF
jgi:hypothetical protein